MKINKIIEKRMSGYEKSETVRQGKEREKERVREIRRVEKSMSKDDISGIKILK